jgi:hypothetical protein
MAFPRIVNVTEGTQASDSTTWSVTYPSDVRVGDVVMLLIGCDGAPIINSVSDGSWITSSGAAAGNEAAILFGKKKAASVLSGSITVTLSVAQQGCWKMILIRGWEGTLGINFTNSDANGGAIPVGGANSGTSTTATISVIDPFNWAAEDTKWLHAAVADGGDTVFTGVPTNYTVVGSNQNSGGADGAALSVAHRNLNASSEDADQFTLTPSEEWCVARFAIRPGSVVDGPRFPGTTASLANAGTSENAEIWVSPGSVSADDGTEANITAATFDTPDISELLVASNFGFTAIPSDATIVGIFAEIERRDQAIGAASDNRVQLAKGTTFASLVGTNKADTALDWPTAATIKTYGGAADLWGTTWTPAEINTSTFALMLSVQADAANTDIFVDYIRVTVYYTEAAPGAGGPPPLRRRPGHRFMTMR